jgi:hypothetical protein
MTSETLAVYSLKKNPTGFEPVRSCTLSFTTIYMPVDQSINLLLLFYFNNSIL